MMQLTFHQKLLITIPLLEQTLMTIYEQSRQHSDRIHADLKETSMIE